METRKQDRLCSFGGMAFFKRTTMNLNVVQQLPSYRYFYERFLTLNKSLPKTMKGKTKTVVMELILEFECIWTHEYSTSY